MSYATDYRPPPPPRRINTRRNSIIIIVCGVLALAGLVAVAAFDLPERAQTWLDRQADELEDVRPEEADADLAPFCVEWITAKTDVDQGNAWASDEVHEAVRLGSRLDPRLHPEVVADAQTILTWFDEQADAAGAQEALARLDRVCSEA